MHNWFECKISYDKTLENGTQKKVTEPYLVDALSFTEAEARIIEELKPYISGEFGIADIKRAKLAEIFFNENGDRYFKAKIYFITLDEKSGTEKKTLVSMLAQACDLKDALRVVEEGMKGTLADYLIAALTETSLVDIFPYDTQKLEKPKEEPTLLDEVYEDPLLDQAKTLLADKDSVSTSLLQRTYSIGYDRANRLMNDLEKAGVVGPFNGAAPRRVIANSVSA